jgi:hypothetical protein
MAEKADGKNWVGLEK